jgi:hypothetical protein
VAEQWLTATTGEVRNERFRPIAAEALGHWQLLRHDANVDIDEIVFAGSGVRRHVRLGVNLDGVGSVALAVVSRASCTPSRSACSCRGRCWPRARSASW